MTAGLLAAAAHAQNPDPTDIRACTAIESDAQRLACYDHATGRVNLPVAQKRTDTDTSTPSIFSRDRKDTVVAEANAEVAQPLSLLDSRWELAPESKLGTFNIRGYKPVYVLPVFATSNQNKQPSSPNPDNVVPQAEQLDNVEAKFQLSLKTKVWQGVFGDTGDLWVGYTQSSRWQVYNADAVATVSRNRLRARGHVGVRHPLSACSAGPAGCSASASTTNPTDATIPQSRSWNRVIANVGFERDGWTVMFTPWWRISGVAQHRRQPGHQRLHGPRRGADRARVARPGVRA